MKSPFEVVQLSASKWTVCAWMQDGVIYLKEIHERCNEMNAVTYAKMDQYNPKHARLNIFRMLLNIHSSKQLNEHDKHFKISEVHMRDLCLVVQSEVNAVTREGEEVKIADRRHDWEHEKEKVEYLSQRWLQLWAYAQVAGQDKIVMCKKRGNVLQDVEVLHASTDAMVQYMEKELSPFGYVDGKTRRTWCPKQACDFLYRLLHFVRQVLTNPEVGEKHAILLSYRKKKTSFIRPHILSRDQTAKLKHDF